MRMYIEVDIEAGEQEVGAALQKLADAIVHEYAQGEDGFSRKTVRAYSSIDPALLDIDVR